MCQYFNKRVPLGKDIIAYKMLKIIRDKRTGIIATIKSPYQFKPYRLNERYDDSGGLYPDWSDGMLFETVIGPRYMHAFAKAEDAFHLAFMRNGRRRIYDRVYNLVPREEFIVAKVILHNTEEGDEIYSGSFRTIEKDYDSYVSRSMTILEILEDVPDTQ